MREGNEGKDHEYVETGRQIDRQIDRYIDREKKKDKQRVEAEKMSHSQKVNGPCAVHVSEYLAS